MFAKVKPTVFIDTLKLQLVAKAGACLKAILRDEKGSVCRSLETTPPAGQQEITWNGLNNLPYGVYTIEVSQGEDAMSMRLVKRV
jgi:hypothetical protein